MRSLSSEAAPKKIKLVISDFHLSAGKVLPDGRRNPLEDFHQDDRFAELLEFYGAGSYATCDVELIINGDFFDPLALILDPSRGVPRGPRLDRVEFPAEILEPEAVRKFRCIVEAHPVVFDGLRAFLRNGKRITFLWGNHDAALLWPGVQRYLTEELCPTETRDLQFLMGPYLFDKVCVDHGHQHEIIHHFDTENIFIRKGAESQILNLPFGSFFVYGFLNRLKLRRNYINQVQPFRTFLRITLYLEPLYVVINGFRAAWFFVKMRLVTHPMRFIRLRKTILILLEVLRRPSLERVANHLLHAENPAPDYDVIIMGHDHQAAHRVFPSGKEYLNTGTWTPITSLNMATLGHRTLRTYALIEYDDVRPTVNLKVWNGRQVVTEDFS